jgi:hypothetical protein
MPRRVPRLFAINAGLLLLIGLAILGTEARDRPAAAVEAGVRRYADAISNGDYDAAMNEIAPDQRSNWSDFVANQVGNIYDVTGVAVHANSLLGQPTDVTTDLDINRAYPDQYYQASPRVGVEQLDGRWYLAAPLLAPTAELQADGGAAETEGGT